MVPASSQLPKTTKDIPPSLKRETIYAEFAQVDKEIRKMEQGDVPLADQLHFVEQLFKPGTKDSKAGLFFRMFASPELQKDDYFPIQSLVNTISERINAAYENNEIPAGLEYLFNIERLEHSARALPLEAVGGGIIYCNGSDVHFQGDVFFVTDLHCLDGVSEQAKMGFERASDGSDMVMKKITNETGEAASDPTQIHSFKSITSNDVIGKPIVSLSWNRDGNKILRWSIAMPQPRNYKTEENNLVMTLAPNDGRVQEWRNVYDANGKVIEQIPILESSGRSGSAVDVITKNGPFYIGNLISAEGMPSRESPILSLGYFSAPEMFTRELKAAVTQNVTFGLDYNLSQVMPKKNKK